MFCSRGSLRMGAGLVKVLSDAGNRQILQTRLPEILFGERKDLEESLECVIVSCLAQELVSVKK